MARKTRDPIAVLEVIQNIKLIKIPNKQIPFQPDATSLTIKKNAVNKWCGRLASSINPVVKNETHLSFRVDFR